MKRRLACIVLAALLLLGLCCTAFAEAPAATEAQLWNITDTVGLLTSDEDLTLEARAEEISAQYGVGIYLLILEDYSEYYDDPYETAYELYHQNTLGMGEDRDGVILLMSMSDRKYATFFYGPKAEYAFDAYGQELMEEEFLDDFRDDDWYDGFEDYLEVCDEYLARAEAGDPVRGDYSSAGGSDGSGIGTTILVCLGISAVIAMIVCLILRGKMKSVRKGTHADAYVTGSLNLTASRDQYTHTTETRTKIEHESSDSGGGGSSACSGGGGSGRSGSF
ncbi:MAG: TPM domain-containing protein [Oscillospiraceae bacterium]